MLSALKCLRCGHAWTPKKADPARCPECKSLRWNIPDSTTYKCSLCGYAAPTKQAVSSHIRFTADSPFGPHGSYGETPTGAEIIEVKHQ